jgi:hypothetical protein
MEYKERKTRVFAGRVYPDSARVRCFGLREIIAAKKPRRLGRRGSRRFQGGEKTVRKTVMRPRITDFAVELGKQISHKPHQ